MKLLYKDQIPDLCCWAGFLCMGLAAGFCRSMWLGGWLDKTAVALAFFALAGITLLLLRRDGVSTRRLKILFLIISLSLLLRQLHIEAMSSDYIGFLHPWVDYYRAHGGFLAISANLGDYNVPYLYFLALISYFPIPDLYLIKLFSFLGDMLLAWGGFRLVRVVRGRREDDSAPYVAFTLLLLLPTVMLNSAYWAQCDAVYSAMVLHAMALVLEGKNVPSIALMGAAFSFKLQSVFLLPFWGVLWLARRVKFRELFAFPAAYFATILPALLLGKPLLDILTVYLHQMEEYKNLTLIAPSIYALFPLNLPVDQDLAARVGICAAFLLAFLLMGAGLWLGKRLDNRAAIAIAAVMAIGVPFFLPRMHDRYFFLAEVVTVSWACSRRQRFPAAVLAVGASMYGYLVYLFGANTFDFSLNGYEFTRWLGGLIMLAALLVSTGYLICELKRCKTLTPE